MSSSCVRHPMTLGSHICGDCGHQFCTECVVHPYGPSKAPLCIACALELGGVRRQRTGRPKLTRRSIRERLAAQRDGSATPIPADEPALDPPVTDRDPWLDGDVAAEELPGGWSQRYE